MKNKIISMGGGLNLESPHLSIKEGQVIEAENFEPDLNGGYTRVQGYERLDGRIKPSDAVWYSLIVDDASGVSLGAITGSSSGATANVVVIDGNELCITNLTGNFNTSDTFSGATVTVVEALEGRDDPFDFGVWELAAQDYYRDLITAVPGTGSILGVWHYNSYSYAFRSNGSVVKMFKSSLSGWVEVTHYQVLNFDAGVGADGDIVATTVIDGGTSSAQGTVKRVVVTDGTWGVDASGYFIVDVTTGAFQDNEAIQVSAVTKATANGADTDIEFTLGANKFDFINYNFKGNESSIRMYGCDGVNNAFEFDGTLLTPIFTGTPTDAPHLIEAHKKHLFLAFAGGSLQHSSLGDPMIWNAILGAAEIALGDSVTGIESITGDTLIVGTDRSIHALYGSSTLDWNLSLIASNTGDVANTLDVLGAPFVVTRNGITRIDSVQAYGNFQSSTVSRLVKPLLDGMLANKNLIGVSVSRAKNQYKIYFDDGFGVVMSYDQLYGQAQLPQFTVFNYLSNPTAVSSVSLDGADEILLFGDDSGFVYQELRGHSFDGEAIVSALRTPFLHLGSPSNRKAFRRYDLEVDVERNAEVRISYEFSYGQSHTAQSSLGNLISDAESQEVLAIGGGGYWDSNDWLEFNWSADQVEQKIASMEGTGHNLSMLFYSSSATSSEFTINNITFSYLMRRANRG